ncbi:MAG: HNH endonuclease [Gammaproteobacteria bacterium]|nr:HNH endonuclease [Gammaproteobacteria bacterium]
MQKIKLFLSIIVVVSLLLPQAALTHRGRTDANGGHNDRKNGGYHYHNSGIKKAAPASTKSYTPRASGSSSGKSKWIDPATGKTTFTTSECAALGLHSASTPAKPKTTTTQSIDRKIGEYFRAANENVGALNCSITTTRRDVPQALKNRVKARDNHRCVICASTLQLEVDHIRALMNGGTNGINNLATLCDDCHTKKTRMDNSLRRKREKLCRS